MHVAIIKALVDTNGKDISGKTVPMPAGSYHQVSKLDLRYFQGHPDVFEVVDSDMDAKYPVTSRKDASGATVLEAGGEEILQVVTKAPKTARMVPLDFAGAAYTVPAGTVTTYTDEVWEGTSYRMTTGPSLNNEASFQYRWTGVGPVVNGNGGYIVPIRVLGIGSTPSPEVRIVISNTVAAGTQNVIALGYLETGLLGDQYLYFPLSSFVEGGGAGQLPYGEYYDFQIKIINKTEGTPVDVQVGPPLYNAAMRPAISIGCDDGLLSQYTELFPLMQVRGLVGTISIAKDYLGATGYMTEAMVDEMYAAGWDVSVHGVLAHTEAAFSTQALLEAEIEYNRAYVASRWPRAAMHYTYIGGAVDKEFSYAALTALGFKSARLVNRAARPGLSAGMTPGAWLKLQSLPILDSTVATRLTDIDALVADYSVQTEIHFHSVAAVSPETPVENTSRANAVLVLDKIVGLKAAGTLDVLTRSQMYNRYS